VTARGGGHAESRAEQSRRAIFNYLDTMIAMVEAGEGTRYVGPHKGAFA
jgi:hypothetical protein